MTMASSITIIQTTDAPEAIGPYSQAVVHGGLLYTAGQIPLDPVTGELTAGDIGPQTERVLQNLGGVLAAAGSSFDRVIKTTVFLRDMNDFAAMNEVYARFFGDHRPARSTVQAARLPRDCTVEIECVAAVRER
jgi:2-iminobutanoate/2-iminopropanoate deaminase